MGKRKKRKEVEEDDGTSWSKEDKQKFKAIVSKRPILRPSMYTYQKSRKLDEYEKVAESMKKLG